MIGEALRYAREFLLGGRLGKGSHKPRGIEQAPIDLGGARCRALGREIAGEIRANDACGQQQRENDPNYAGGAGDFHTTTYEGSTLAL